MLDLDLPVADEPVPTLPSLPLETVYAVNDQFCADTVYDDAYFARSLKRKNRVPFVM